MDLYRDNYWATPRKLAHEYGLEFVTEPYQGPWDTREVVRDLDHASMEFWTHNNTCSSDSAREVIDTAHTLGQRIVGAEAFTTPPELAAWQAHPAWLKPIGDAAFCDGVNRFNIHHFVQQPWGPDYQLGNAMGQWGIYLGRYQTWWKPSKAWFTYLWRCQTLLQCGEFAPPSPQSSAQLTAASGSLELKSTHRLHRAEHTCFIANLAGSTGIAHCSFPVTGLQAELWAPSGAPCATSTPPRSPTAQPPSSSSSLLRKASSSSSVAGSAAPPHRPPPRATLTPLAELSGSWNVRFDPKRGAPASIVFPSLHDWSTHSDKGIRYYSGTGIYTRRFQVLTIDRTKKHWLDLGSVKYIATVTLNGKPLGVVWTAP